MSQSYWQRKLEGGQGNWDAVTKADEYWDYDPAIHGGSGALSDGFVRPDDRDFAAMQSEFAAAGNPSYWGTLGNLRDAVGEGETYLHHTEWDQDMIDNWNKQNYATGGAEQQYYSGGELNVGQTTEDNWSKSAVGYLSGDTNWAYTPGSQATQFADWHEGAWDPDYEWSGYGFNQYDPDFHGHEFRTASDFIANYDAEAEGPIISSNKFQDHTFIRDEDVDAAVKWGDDKYRSLYYNIDAETGGMSAYNFTKANTAQQDAEGNITGVGGGDHVPASLYQSDVLEGLFDTSQWKSFTLEQKAALNRKWSTDTDSKYIGEWPDAETSTKTRTSSLDIQKVFDDQYWTAEDFGLLTDKSATSLYDKLNQAEVDWDFYENDAAYLQAAREVGILPTHDSDKRFSSIEDIRKARRQIGTWGVDYNPDSSSVVGAVDNLDGTGTEIPTTQTGAEDQIALAEQNEVIENIPKEPHLATDAGYNFGDDEEVGSNEPLDVVLSTGATDEVADVTYDDEGDQVWTDDIDPVEGVNPEAFGEEPGDVDPIVGLTEDETDEIRHTSEMADEAEYQADVRVEGEGLGQVQKDLGGSENWQVSAGNWVDEYLAGLDLTGAATTAGQTAGQTAGAAAASDAGYLTGDQLSSHGFQTAGDVAGQVEGYGYQTAGDVGSQVEGYGYQTASDVGGLVSQAVDPLSSQLSALDKTFDEFESDQNVRDQQTRAYNQLLIRDAERARVAASYGAGGRPLNKKVKGVRMGSSRDDDWDSRPTFNTFNRGGLRISSLNI